MGNQKQIEVSPLSDKEVFDEIIRRIVNEHFQVFFSETRYYEILSEHFLQGFEYDLDSLEPVQSFALEEDIRKIDEWLAFKKVYYGLEGRPGYHPLKEILEKTWIAYFKTWVLRDEGDSWAIDWILSVPLFSKNRTRSQIAELLGCTVTGQKKGRPEKTYRSFRELLHVEDNDELWENIHKTLQELFDNDYHEHKKRVQILWILWKVRKMPGENPPSEPELAEAYKGASLPVINDRNFKGNGLGSIKDEKFKNMIKELFQDMK